MPPLSPSAADDAVALLSELVRLDTSGPAHAEAPAAQLLAEFLRKDGYEPVIREKAPGRSNLVVRRKGDGSGGEPLLLTGHLDTVPADPAGWRHPPFAGEIHDGWLWGRGALDMKNHLAACATVMRELARAELPLKRDVIFAAVADEEAGCSLGSRFLVEDHPELIRAEYALGEFGAVTTFLGGQRLYPIMVAHKGAAWLRMRAKGPSGHGSIPRSDSAPMHLARAVMRLGNAPLPVRVTPAARTMLSALAAAVGGSTGLGMRLLQRPALTDFVLERLIDDAESRGALGAILHDTAAATCLRAGDAPNVLPPTAEATVDARLVPGQTTAGLLEELAYAVDDDLVSFEVRHEVPAYEAPADTPLFRRLEGAIRAMDPAGTPFPYLASGFTDAGALARLGIKTYGFTPIVLPDSSVPASRLIHGVDERVPVEGFKKGVHALWDVVSGFCA